MTDTPQRPVRAVCHRCGGPKQGPFVPCKTCSFVPLGEERPIAWLFGLDYLTEEEMLQAGERVRGGEGPDPSSALRELARERMGALPLSSAQLKPLSNWQLLGLSVGNLVLTPPIQPAADLVGVREAGGGRQAQRAEAIHCHQQQAPQERCGMPNERATRTTGPM